MTIQIRARQMANGMIRFEFHSGQFRAVVQEDGSMEMDDYECYSFKADKFNDEIRKVFEYTGVDKLLVIWENGYDLGWLFKKERFIS